ncbi:hypothetical protein D9M69_611870 [compost metagenome]
MAACGEAPLRSSSRTRSLISTLESMATPMASAMAAMPGSVSVACNIERMATSSIRFTASAIDENRPNSA